MNGHAMSRSELVQAILVEPLSFFYASLVYPSYRDSLLHFLALVRLRINSNTLVLAPSSLPLRLHLLNLPNEITHEIYDHLFHSLIEDEKLQVLDKIGLCPHSGSCFRASRPSLEPGPSDPDHKWVGGTRIFPVDDDGVIIVSDDEDEPDGLILGTMGMVCACVDCSKRRREAREVALKEGTPGGVCWVDFVPTAGCCRAFGGRGEGNDEDGTEHRSCGSLRYRRALELGSVFSSYYELSSLVRSFDLTLFAPPSISIPPHDISTALIQPLHEICLAPSILGLSSSSSTPEDDEPESSQQFNLLTTNASISHSFSHSNTGRPVSHFYVEEARQLTELELRRFERLARSLRLRREEGATKVFPVGPGRALM